MPFVEKAGKSWAQPARGRGGLARRVISALTRPRALSLGLLRQTWPLCLPRAARRDSGATAEVQELGFVGRQNDSVDGRRRADCGRQNPKTTPRFPALSSGTEKG